MAKLVKLNRFGGAVKHRRELDVEVNADANARVSTSTAERSWRAVLPAKKAGRPYQELPVGVAVEVSRECQDNPTATPTRQLPAKPAGHLLERTARQLLGSARGAAGGGVSVDLSFELSLQHNPCGTGKKEEK